MSWRHGGGWGGYAPYVSKAERMRNAAKFVAALQKKRGVVAQPVVAGRGRELARTWWGKAWCGNLERYADFANRLPRGRTYARNGSVLDLQIAANSVTALVMGSNPKPYTITIKIKPLGRKLEEALFARSRAALDSLQSLLSGEFPAELKEAFFERGTGLFPPPEQIEFKCSCPDWASMCKHVAAALYGVAVRLDEKPELFFVLRGIKIDDFVGQMVQRESEKMLRKAKVRSGRVIEAEAGDLSQMFGISMEGATAPDPEPPPAAPPAAPIEKRGKPAKRKAGRPLRRKPDA